MTQENASAFYFHIPAIAKTTKNARILYCEKREILDELWDISADLAMRRQSFEDVNTAGDDEVPF